VTYANDGAALLEEMALQGIEGPTSPVCSADCPFPVMGADGIADMGFLAAFSDPSAAGGVIATKPSSGTDSAAKADFEAAWAAYYVDDDGNPGNASAAIYTHETYDAVTMIGQAAMNAECASQTCGPAVRDALRALGDGYTGASGTHSFDSVGDVAGSGYDVCQFVPVIVDGQPSLQLACTGHFGNSLTFPGAAHIKIGMLNPMTGPIAVYAPGFTIASQVAIGYMNTIAPLTFQFELVMADSGCDGTTAATAAQTLIDAGVVGIAGAACSGATLGAIEVAKTAGVPMVSYASTSPAITNHDDDDVEA
jgi:ABC-type branched-subunit amino acid transport system substrate-binding protein